MISSRYVFIIFLSFRLFIFHISHLINFIQLHMQAMSKFITASRQATEMDHNRARLEAKISEVQANYRGKAKMATKAMDEVKELKNLVEELKADMVKKDTHLDHLQKGNDELRALLKKAKEDAIEEFKASSQFIVLLDGNYVAGFEDFHMDAEEYFLEVDFSSIKLNIGVASTLLQTSSEDVNIEDDATTQPAQDEPNSGKNLPQQKMFEILSFHNLFPFLFIYLSMRSIVLDHFI